MKRIILYILLFLAPFGAYAQDFVGTFGNGVEFHTEKVYSNSHGSYVSGYIRNRYNQRNDFEIVLRCDRGEIMVNSMGKSFDIKASQENELINISPAMGGYFKIFKDKCSI